MGLTLSRRQALAGAGAALLAQGYGRRGLAGIVGTDGAVAYRRMVGELEVTALLDGYFEVSRDLLLGIDPETASAAIEAVLGRPDAPLIGGITAQLVRLPDRIVLMDTGTGGVFGPTTGHLTAGLAAAGVTPDAVDVVLISHMHGDHIGGLLPGGDVAFANAEIRIPDAELGFWTDEAIAAGAPEAAQPNFALARDVVAAYGDRIVPFSGETELVAGITSVPLPGHTPGHTGYRIASGEDELLYWADVLVVAPIQFAHPDANTVFDIDPGLATETRTRALEAAASGGTLAAGTHLPFPTYGRVRPAEPAFAWMPEFWQY
jgi:glyoxylase-like metal-dependent hydrolase (beta-lactamase superfamily II)